MMMPVSNDNSAVSIAIVGYLQTYPSRKFTGVRPPLCAARHQLLAVLAQATAARARRRSMPHSRLLLRLRHQNASRQRA
jgi:hypothetical protein